MFSQEVLEDAGVYKRTGEGRAAFLRFTDSVNCLIFVKILNISIRKWELLANRKKL